MLSATCQLTCSPSIGDKCVESGRELVSAASFGRCKPFSCRASTSGRSSHRARPSGGERSGGHSAPTQFQPELTYYQWVPTWLSQLSPEQKQGVLNIAGAARSYLLIRRSTGSAGMLVLGCRRLFDQTPSPERAGKYLGAPVAQSKLLVFLDSSSICPVCCMICVAGQQDSQK